MKRAIKLTFQLTVALVILLLLAALITGCFIMFGSVGAKDQFTYLFVLGTTVDGTEPSPMLADRIEVAAKYMQKNPNVIAVVTGGKADEENISEAQCMYNELTKMGIDGSRIILCGAPIAVGAAVYFVCVVLMKSITHDDCLLLPKGDKIAKLLKL